MHGIISKRKGVINKIQLCFMKKMPILLVVIVFIATIIIILSSGLFPSQAECQKLGRNLDNYITYSQNLDENRINVDAAECQNWLGTRQSIMVGGTLIDKEDCQYVDTYKHYECDLTFEGYDKQGKLLLTSSTDSLPYQIGQFYRFDLGGYCERIFSMAFSGSFGGDLEPLNCR